MAPKNKDIDKIISRTLSGNASNREEKELKDWILEDDENYLEFKIIQESAQKSYKERKLLITDETFRNIWDTTNIPNKIPKYKIGFSIFKTSAVSAAGLALILLSVFSYRQIVIKQEIAHKDGQPVMIEKFSPMGQISKVFLPDGSLVWLNADSKLQYASSYGKKTRTVSLTGEAYFDVKLDQTKPFVVKSGNVAITASGTAFNVNTYFNNSDIEIVLDEGELTIENLFSSLIPGMPLKTTLVPGDKAIYSLRESVFAVDNINDSFDYTCWKDGILSFKHADFETVIKSLERWYGVEFTYDGQPDSGWNYTGDFNNEYLESVLKALGLDGQFSYEINNNAVQLIFRERQGI
jgi:ferric-dicitrate binding protein FerR (iron transport regulator)